jgi:hypothetical protein
MVRDVRVDTAVTRRRCRKGPSTGNATGSGSDVLVITTMTGLPTRFSNRISTASNRERDGELIKPALAAFGVLVMTISVRHYSEIRHRRVTDTRRPKRCRSDARADAGLMLTDSRQIAGPGMIFDDQPAAATGNVRCRFYMNFPLSAPRAAESTFGIRLLNTINIASPTPRRVSSSNSIFAWHFHSEIRAPRCEI